MYNNLIIVFKEDPDKVPGGPQLTADEAARMASHCFYNHDHKATKPQEPIFWWRMQEDYSA